jgi:hypothetical protein
MAEFGITSFKYGLDTRKDMLTSQPGTLVTCENAHINPGGEIEKRKAFVEYANVAINDDGGSSDQGVFGIESTDAGIIVFGSALLFGASVTQAQPRLQSAIPAGVTYQQLKHPSLANDTSILYSRSIHRITSIPFSENYNGKAFVCALFADGNRFLYYDGSLIQQSANGLVLTGRTTLADLADDLDRQIEAVNWTAIANVNDDETTVQNGSVIVKSPQSDYFSVIPSISSSAGLVGVRDIANDGPATPGVHAIAAFRITVNTGTFTLTAPTNADGTGTAALTGGAVAVEASATLTATLIVKTVNELTYIHGYSALQGTGADTDVVQIFAPIGYDLGTVASPDIALTVTPTTGATAAPGSSPSGLSLLLTPSSIAKTIATTFQQTGTRSVLVQDSVTATGQGGTGIFSYAWTETIPVGGTTSGIQMISDLTSSLMTFRLPLDETDPPATPPSGRKYVVQRIGFFKCVVTSGAATVEKGVTVFLRLEVTY